MATFARKCFSPKKYFKFLITQNIQTLLKIPTIFVAEIREKKSYNFRGNYSFLDVFGHRTKSHRGNWWFRFPHVLSVFGALYISFSNPAECMNNEESLSSMSKIGIAESPETNRHNKRNSNGRFSKLRKGGHKEKSLHPLRKGLAARRSLVFDECDENEPPSKRQTRSEKVQYKVVHLFIFFVL